MEFHLAVVPSSSRIKRLITSLFASEYQVAQKKAIRRFAPFLLMDIFLGHPVETK